MDAEDFIPEPFKSVGGQRVARSQTQGAQIEVSRAAEGQIGAEGKLGSSKKEEVRRN